LIQKSEREAKIAEHILIRNERVASEAVQ
jgi:hypothetical protein